MIGCAKILSTFVANCRYWQVEILHDDRNKNGFKSYHGVFCFTPMSFEMKDMAIAVSTSEILPTDRMSVPFFAPVYLRNVVIFFKCQTIIVDMFNKFWDFHMKNEEAVNWIWKNERFYQLPRLPWSYHLPWYPWSFGANGWRCSNTYARN